MTRKLSRIAGKLGPPLVAVLLAGLLMTGLRVASAALPDAYSRAALAATATDSEQCYSWEAINGTEQDADRLQIELTGVQTVTQVYVGDANPLGGAATGSGYDAGTDRYTLVLGPNGSIVGPVETVRVGICTPQFVSGARFQWLAGANPLLPAAVLPALEWNWLAADTAQLQLTNTTGVSITLTALQLLDPGQPLELDDLDASVVTHLPLASAALEEPLELAPGAVMSSTLTLDPDPAGAQKAVLFEAQWSEGDDLLAASAFYVQTSAPASGRIYLPALSR